MIVLNFNILLQLNAKLNFPSQTKRQNTHLNFFVFVCICGCCRAHLNDIAFWTVSELRRSTCAKSSMPIQIDLIFTDMASNFCCNFREKKNQITAGKRMWIVRLHGMNPCYQIHHDYVHSNRNHVFCIPNSSSSSFLSTDSLVFLNFPLPFSTFFAISFSPNTHTRTYTFFVCVRVSIIQIAGSCSFGSDRDRWTDNRKKNGEDLIWVLKGFPSARGYQKKNNRKRLLQQQKWREKKKRKQNKIEWVDSPNLNWMVFFEWNILRSIFLHQKCIISFQM